jgi:O-antigen/teichoic acid export membrane protein
VVDRFLWFAYSNLDVAIAGKLLGAEILGFYTVALQLAAIPLDKVLPVLTQVAFPAVARIQKEPERVRQNMLKAFRYANLLFLPVFWGMALVATDALPLILGEHWATAVVPFQMICVILPLKAIAALVPPALFGIGRPLVNVGNMAISLALLAVGFGVGARWGLVGLAGAWMAVYPVVFVGVVTRALGTLGLWWADLLRGWRGPWVAALAMATAVLGVQILGEGWSTILRLVLAILSGAVAYVAAIHLVDRAAVNELRALLAR